MSNKRFIPVRGTEAKLDLMGFNDGYIYFAVDTGKIYLDYTQPDGSQVYHKMLGGSDGGTGGNSGIYYANYTLTDADKLEDEISIPISAIEGGEYPNEDDLIINLGDNCFYRVIKIQRNYQSVLCRRLTVAGGSSSGDVGEAADIYLEINDLPTINLINDSPQEVTFKAISALDKKGNPYDKTITISWKLEYTDDIESGNWTLYNSGMFTVASGVISSFEVGKIAKNNATSRLTFVASQTNHSSTKTGSIVFSTSKLELQSGSFSNLNYFQPDKIVLRCNVYGSMDKLLEYYFDDPDIPFYSVVLDKNAQVDQSKNVAEIIPVKQITNGYHKVWIRLFQYINGEKGVEVTPLVYEIAVYDEIDPNAPPIIWLGDYKEEYYNYDVIQVPFRVFDPQTEKPIVHFKRNNIELSYSPQTITDAKNYSIFEIANPELNIINHYTISCGDGERETIRKIDIRVVQDPNRTDFGVQRKDLLTYMINTIGSGRSNAETLTKRTTLINASTALNANPCPATFTNFNWYNNGWTTDEENRTCLRISNGAELSIPIGPMVFSNPNGSSATEQSHTIEFMFKIRNVQDYSNLIHTITRYNNDKDLYTAFYDEEAGKPRYENYTNYDAFLAWYLKNNYIPIEENGQTRRMEYDDLEFSHIAKQINLNNVVCQYASGDTKAMVGLCLGPQDAFFSNGIDTVNVSYVEDQIITLSIVCKYSQESIQNLIYIYLNGVLTGVTRNTQKNGFTIEDDAIKFNSKYCDIDLYKIRVYRTDLDVNNIVMNYAVDFENVNIYDQNKLAEENTLIDEFQFNYNNMIKYNNEHPDAPLMPYVIFDTTKLAGSENKLPYSKKVKLNVGVEFVNTPLEMYYNKGKLEELAKADGLFSDGASAEEKREAVETYYKYHCPSFISDNAQISVQGTSSEFYPRRNYKVKTKNTDSDKVKRVNILLNRGPFKDRYNADILGLSQKPYILSTTLGPLIDSATGQLKIKYYEDAKGEKEVTFSESYPYKPNTFYIKNTAYVARGDEQTRQDYWYFNNYTCGTTKFTMKIDFMESSGTYNMGFANMVKNGYSKHPLDDYNDAKAFQIEDPNKTIEVETTEYISGTTYTYYNHNGKSKDATDQVNEDNLVITSKEDFDLGPYALYEKLMAVDSKTYKKLKVAGPDSDKYNKWYIKKAGYSNFEVENTDDYRTSVRGFRVLAFHKKKPSDGSSEPIYQFIGIYNMLLDKGSDEVYGFALDNTTGKDPLAKFVGNGATPLPKIAECWEFENNSRTFCSFRDPQGRKDLKFDVFDSNGDRVLNAVRSAPVVADSFEYRYHNDADILDYLMTGEGSLSEKDADLTFNSDNIKENQDNRANRLLKDYSNWERAVAWVWSTCTDDVVSNGTYTLLDIGEELFDSSIHYIMNIDPLTSEITYILAEEYDASTTYYKKNANYNPSDSNSKEYIVAYVGAILFKDKQDELYYGSYDKNGNISYVPCSTNDDFSPDYQYYVLEMYSDEQLENQADRLVDLCTNESFDENQIYYTYDGNAKCGNAVNKIELTTETYEPNKYYIGKTVTYGTRSYKYDTKEYRGDKFIKELSKHFDKEYMATYFVMTEVFECYDSRGKNCMMASWGPQEKDGDYIWYPIFYDIDTQLGINNTGIPSFDYNVDATEDGNYSTSDSVLWNNFYRYFKTSLIIPKYKHLRGTDTNVFGIKLSQPPLKTIDRIESYYLTDYNTTGNLADLGTRPLIAVNLDEYYKYITITNSASYEDGTTGYIGSSTTGDYIYDPSGGSFYALQGNRSLSRRQFLTNRLEYIDSWLNQGNYQRGGENRIQGRIAANNKSKTSDKWVETANDPYFKDEDALIKNHLFDAEYWMTLTPTHSSYVTLGDDNEAYPSKKYDGINPLRFNIDSIETGFRERTNYPEQLLYVYGLNQIKDLGDMSNLYWQEFKISGNASKLTSLKLGYDGLDENGERWHNDNVNQFVIPASESDANGMPLLKEVNMSNIQFNATAPTLDLTSCEKLENFRATGTNLTNIEFAEGVALNTAYLPTSITNLELVEANLLKNVITEDEYEYPARDAAGNLQAKPGLYLQGFFDKTGGNKGDTSITSLAITGGGLGYDSYKLLKQYYAIRSQQTTTSQISMTKVNWCPYTQMTIDDERDPSITYYIDNGHYGLESYTYTNYNAWTVKVENGEIYRKDETISDEKINQITDLTMFKEFISDKKWVKNSNKTIPEISGIIYINNTDIIKESELRNTIQVAYPDLKIFCANVEQGYTARFVVMDEDEGEDGRYSLIGSMTLKNGETWFPNPIDTFKVKDITDKKPNHDFLGWALTNDPDADLLVNVDKSINKWDEQTLDPNIHTYTFYAICPIHKWSVSYYYKDGTLIEQKEIPNGQPAPMSTIIPWKDDSDLPLEQTYKFLGYNRSTTATSAIKLEDYIITEDTVFYAVFDNNPINVYDDIHPEYFAVSTQTSGAISSYVDDFGESKWNILDGVTLGLTKKVKGKLTVPAFFTVDGVQKKVIGIDATFGAPGNTFDNDIDYPTHPDFPGKSDTNKLTVLVPVCYGENLTHVFFEKYEENGVKKCNLRKICYAAFSNAMNLVWVEFPEGLRVIGAYAFKMLGAMNRVVYPKFTNANIGGTIIDIEKSAFVNTFGSSVDTLVIGPTVQRIAKAGISFVSNSDYNPDRILGIKSIIIGTPDEKSKLEPSSAAIVNYGADSAITIDTVTWYTNLEKNDTNSKLFSGFKNITYINGKS